MINIKNKILHMMIATYIQKVLLFIVGTIIYYFMTVFVLFILGLMFKILWENIWLIAIPVTIFAELLLIASYFFGKYKKRKKQRSSGFTNVPAG